MVTLGSDFHGAERWRDLARAKLCKRFKLEMESENFNYLNEYNGYVVDIWDRTMSSFHIHYWKNDDMPKYAFYGK